MDTEKLQGLVAAPFAPMDENGEGDISRIPDYYNLLVHNGVKGVFLNGSTGEGVSLTSQEKKDIVGAWISAGKSSGKLRIINLAGGNSLKECIDQAVYAANLGTDAVALMAPFYFRPASTEVLGSFIRRVACCIPDTPLYYYHIPALTGVSLPMTGLLEYADSQIANFAGIKYTNDDMADYFSCLVYKGHKYDILWGRDETLLSALILGAGGAVGSTYNYAAPLYNMLIENYRKCNFDIARTLQLRSVELVSVLIKYGGIGAGKAFMKYIGMDCGDFRPPVVSVNEDDFPAFEKDLKALSIEDLLSRKPSKLLI